MACIVRNKRLQAIADMVTAIVSDPELNIKNYDDVVKYFNDNFPEVTEMELSQALIPLEDLKTDEITDTLRVTKERLNTLQTAVNGLERVLTDKSKTNQIFNALLDAAKKEKIDIVLTEDERNSALDTITGVLEKSGSLDDMLSAIFNPTQAATIKPLVENKVLEIRTSDPRRTGKSRNEEAQEIAQLIKDIRTLAGRDLKVPPEVYGEIQGRLERLAILENAYWSMDTPVTESHIRRAVEDMRRIKREARIDQVNARMVELDKQIEALNSGEVKFEDIENLDTNVKFKGLDREIAAKERELQNKRVEFEAAMARAKWAAKGRKGIMGFKGKPAAKLAEFGWLIKENIWEPWRALKFMADVSAFGVQAAPVVYSMMTDLNLNRVFGKGNDSIFASQKDLLKSFWRDGIKPMVDGVRHAEKGWKGTRSSYAQEMFNKIKQDPAYVIAKNAKLQLSEFGSLTNSEEMFTSKLLNKIYGIGLIKDISEASMVTTLNSLRMLKFKKFYEATGGTLSMEEYTKVAELINKMTGTTATSNTKVQTISRGLSYILSAPKLFISRLSLFTIGLPKAIMGLDIPKTFTNNNLKNGIFEFQSEADRFIFNEFMKMARGYVLIPILLNFLIPDLDFEEDATETHFMRYRYDDKFIDATGGVGTIYRTLAKAYMMTYGAPEGASYSTKQKNDYLTNIQKKDGMEALLTGFVRYKLHPTISGTYNVLRGKDFFGNKYHKFFGRNGLAPHAEAMARMMMPISLESVIDDSFSISEGKMTFGESLALNMLQMTGMNAFKASNKLDDPDIQVMMDKEKYSPTPEYPEALKNAGGDDTKKYYRDQFKEIWGNVYSEIIVSEDPELNLSKKQLEGLKKKADKLAEEKFMEQYGDRAKEELGEKAFKKKTSRRGRPSRSSR